MTESLRQKFASGRPLGALWLSLGSPAIAELAAAAEPDLIVFDCQHGLWDRATLEAGIGHAARAAPVMVRLADHAPASISEALDAGAEAVLAPLVETADEARAFAAAPAAACGRATALRPMSSGRGATLPSA
jgi:4-hydroxy-2-oxoheptanedioate aldolase